jgi:hypothetical protein
VDELVLAVDKKKKEIGDAEERTARLDTPSTTSRAVSRPSTARMRWWTRCSRRRGS